MVKNMNVINGLPRLLISRYYFISILPNIIKRKYIRIMFSNFINSFKCEICRKRLSYTDYILRPIPYKIKYNDAYNTTDYPICLKCNNILELKETFNPNSIPYINYSNILLSNEHIFLTVGNYDYMGL